MCQKKVNNYGNEWGPIYGKGNGGGWDRFIGYLKGKKWVIKSFIPYFCILESKVTLYWRVIWGVTLYLRDTPKKMCSLHLR